MKIKSKGRKWGMRKGIGTKWTKQITKPFHPSGSRFMIRLFFELTFYSISCISSECISLYNSSCLDGWPDWLCSDEESWNKKKSVEFYEFRVLVSGLWVSACSCARSHGNGFGCILHIHDYVNGVSMRVCVTCKFS